MSEIRCHSWKFPDKIATEVNVNELLQRYNFGRNEVDNQVSHIVLFEILIDRMLLILHGSSRILNDIPKHFITNKNESMPASAQQTNLSVGLVVRNYWKKLSQLFALLEHHQVCLFGLSINRNLFLLDSARMNVNVQ